MVFSVFLGRSILRFDLFSAAYNLRFMSNFYIRSVQGSDCFQAVFLFKYNSLNISREFNFNRKVEETLGDFVTRIKGNLAKVISKKFNRMKKKKSEVQNTISIDESGDIDVLLLVDGKETSLTTKCRDIFFNDGSKNIEFKILDTYYRVIVNSPWVDCLSLPSVAMVGFPVFPSICEISHGNIHDSRFIWLNGEGQKWEEVGSGYSYIPSESDISKVLKLHCIPSNGNICGPEIEAVGSSPVISGPGLCPFEERHKYSKVKLDNSGVRVVSYNILADVYTQTELAKTGLFSYCPSDAMVLDYRKQLYIKEILGYNADIICLQEVDEKVYLNEFVHIFNQFSGFFARKAGTIHEGVAMFFCTNKFRLIEEHRVLLGEDVGNSPIYGELWNKLRANPNVAKNLQERSSVLQVCLLERLENPQQKLVVANTHLYFHPDADHIRLAQGAICMKYIQHFIEKRQHIIPSHEYSLIFCGDFNSVPECGFYHLMTENYIPKYFKDWKAKEGEHVEDLELFQPFPMASAYGTPAFTNYTASFVDCLDYIYYQTNRFKLKQTNPLPSEDVVKRHTAIPSIVFPSDHLALIADFEWIT